MEIVLGAIRARSWRQGEPGRQLLGEYVERASRTLPVSYEEFRSEADFWEWVARRKARSPAFVIVADSRGQPMDSERFARELARVRDHGIQQVVICIGPADGWPTEALQRADLVLSFGRMTLPHELAAIVAAEQIYRATAIWSGHPYHSGH